MATMLTVAAAICGRYEKTHGEKIDEMKLHKLLYFTQREALIQTGEFLFEDEFHGWRYGPVMKKLRKPYQDGKLPQVSPEEEAQLKPILDAVFAEFGDMDAFSLSRLTHGEISWRTSRKGVAPTANSDKAIRNTDIQLDALRIRERKKQLAEHNLL